MAIKGFDFELNGVKYMAAEDAEGDHYVEAAEPLRPPNAVTVQGESSQKFQMRADTLLWSITDWSGGENQYKYSARSPNRARILQGVRAFEKPGTLTPGYYVEDTQNNGASDLVIDGQLVIGAGALYLLDANTNDSYLWNDATKRWGTSVALTGVTAGAVRTAIGDNANIYWNESGTQNLWKWDGSGAPATISTATIDANNSHLVALGAYVYSCSSLLGLVWESAKSGSGTTIIDDFSGDSGIEGLSLATGMDGRIYFAVPNKGGTVVRQITPTTAAGTGFGSEIARLPGFIAQSLWSHSGVLYMIGDIGTNEDAVMYLIPGGSYGTLGLARIGEDLGRAVGQGNGSGLLEHYFAAAQTSGTDSQSLLFQVDSVGGGFAVLGIDEDGSAKAEEVDSVAVFDGQIFWSGHQDNTTRRVMRAYLEGYTKTSYTISPWHDFELADEKILGSLVLSVEALPADWTVEVDYAIDNVDTFTGGITYTTTNGKGTKLKISTDASTVKFRTISIRIRMTYTGGGVPTSGPVITGVDVMAMVSKPTGVWRIMLDLSDDKSGNQGHSGAKKIANIRAAKDTQDVVDFKDGYLSRTPNTFTAYDVTIDSYVMLLSHPGEGVVQVTLKEVP